MGEKPLTLGEDFSTFALWNIVGSRAVPFTTSSTTSYVTKYRKPVLRADIAVRLINLIREICKSNDVEIMKGYVSKDHVHIFVSVPPNISVSQLVKLLKGKTSRKLMMECKSISRAFWGRHMWARGYFVASSGNVTDEVIIKYIEQQS